MSFRFPISQGLSPPFTSYYNRNRQTVKGRLRPTCEGCYPSREAKASGISAHSFKVCDETNLVYVMANHDGSSVYRIGGPAATVPNYNYDETSVIDFVKNAHFKENALAAPSLSERIQSASARVPEHQTKGHMNSKSFGREF